MKREGNNSGTKGKELVKNMYEWAMDMDNSVGIDCRSRVGVGWAEEGKGEKLGQL